EMAARLHRAVRVGRAFERVYGMNQRRDGAAREERQHVTRERMDDRGLLLGRARPQDGSQDALSLTEQPADVELASTPAHDADDREPAARRERFLVRR